MHGCKKRTTSDTTSSARPRTWRTAMQTGLRVHVKLPIVRRRRVPPTTTSWHRPPSHNSAYFASLSWRASVSTPPSTIEAFGRARPQAVTALRTVMSTASCAPWFNSKPEANTSIAFVRRWDADVHVPQLGVPPHGGTSLAAHAREGAFCGDSSGTPTA